MGEQWEKKSCEIHIHMKKISKKLHKISLEMLMWSYHRKAPLPFAKHAGLFLEHFLMTETDGHMDSMAPGDCLLTSQFSRRGPPQQRCPAFRLPRATLEEGVLGPT